MFSLSLLHLFSLPQLCDAWILLIMFSATLSPLVQTDLLGRFCRELRYLLTPCPSEDGRRPTVA